MLSLTVLMIAGPLVVGAEAKTDAAKDQPKQAPPIDQRQPKKFQTATFALG